MKKHPQPSDLEDNYNNNQLSDKEESEIFPGYPLYPAEDDIFVKGHKESRLDPEQPTEMKAPNEIPGKRNEKDFDDDLSGSDLDIPGAELDDENEAIGNEDEENNYYSLGGDNHTDLEEDNGD